MVAGRCRGGGLCVGGVAGDGGVVAAGDDGLEGLLEAGVGVGGVVGGAAGGGGGEAGEDVFLAQEGGERWRADAAGGGEDEG